MWKKIIFGIFISALIAAGIYWFTYTKELRTPVSEAINAIPGNAALIFESKQSKNTWKKLSRGNAMWTELLGAETFAKLDSQTRYLDSLIRSNAAISQLPDNRSLFISAHVSGATTFDFLYVYSLPNRGYQSKIDEFIKNINIHRNSRAKSPVRNYSGVDITTIHPSANDSLSYAFLDGILLISLKQTLVEDAIRQLKSGISIAKDKNLKKVINTAGQNADANVYLNYKNFPGIFRRFIAPGTKKEINSLADLADWSGWDVTIKPDAFMLNGFTEATDSSTNFLNLFRKQKPTEIAVTKIIPSKTALLLFFGISNVKSFHYSYKKYLKALSQGRAQHYVQFIEKVNTKYDINIERSMLEWVGNEMALVVTEPSSNDFTNNSFAVIHSDNIDDAVNTLTTLADSVAKKDRRQEIKKRTEKKTPKSGIHFPTALISTPDYRNHIIKHLNLPGLLPQLFGFQFNKITGNYFTAINDYIVFANNKEALENFIDDFENNKTLGNDKNYRTFSENVSIEANVYLYSSIARSPKIYSAFVTEELAKDMEKNLDLFHKFEAAAIQFSSTTASNKLFYSSVYIKYNPKYKQESGTLWELQLDTIISSSPHVVINHNTNTKEIVVQDDANKLYLISDKGKTLWTKQLSGKIKSDVIQVDAFKNNRLQMLFNTSSDIYMVDRNGSDVKGFPIKLKSLAANAVLVTDYAKNRDYRIFVACENKTIRCYNSNGEEVTGFNFDKTENKVNLALQYVSSDNKDVLCAIDEGGEVYLLNRQGAPYLKMKDKLAAGIRNFYIESGTTFNSSAIIAADTSGNIMKMRFNGIKENIHTAEVDEPTFVDYKDINKDGSKEYVFISGDELKVFSQDKSLLFSYEFKENIAHAPLFLPFSDGTEKIAVLSEKTGDLFLFNADGTLYKGFPLDGKTPFRMATFSNEEKINVITGFDKSVYFYQLDKTN